MHPKGLNEEKLYLIFAGDNAWEKYEEKNTIVLNSFIYIDYGTFGMPG
jgi:hypothetical protein